MKATIRYALVFTGAAVAGVYLHEIGHAVAGWIQGIAVVPTPETVPLDSLRCVSSGSERKHREAPRPPLCSWFGFLKHLSVRLERFGVEARNEFLAITSDILFFYRQQAVILNKAAILKESFGMI